MKCNGVILAGDSVIFVEGKQSPREFEVALKQIKARTSLLLAIRNNEFYFYKDGEMSYVNPLVPSLDAEIADAVRRQAVHGMFVTESLDHQAQAACLAANVRYLY